VLEPVMKYPAPAQAEIDAVELEVGASLPAALTATYASRGNGGFGPEYGVLGLASGHITDQGDTALELYRMFASTDPDDLGWVWPKHLLPILHIGCAIYLCVDLQSPGNPIVQFDPNGYAPGGNLDNSFTVAFPTLELWLLGPGSNNSFKPKPLRGSA
jgi:hypothetical protein